MATLKVSKAKRRKEAAEVMISLVEKRRKIARAKNTITADRIG
jgi:hypothetical protein